VNKEIFKDLLVFLYGQEKAENLTRRLLDILEKEKSARTGTEGVTDARRLPFTHRDAFLISYGNMLSAPSNEPPGNAAARGAASGLSLLRDFLETRNRGAFSYLHVLPFHPYSSDDGFSVIDYRELDSRFGSWEDLEKLKELPVLEGNLKLAFDFVINHGSVQSSWFKGFLAGEEKYRDWYITRPEDYDSRSVVRPRTHPLLTAFEGPSKEKVYVWTTFSSDQADYDFSNPDVLLEFIAILLEYAERGADIVRLDAIAYLWKEDGTPCLHHPKTHAVVKLFRAIVDYLELPLLILTETNVPHKENISYFGSAVGDVTIDNLPEAHMVYNFALPPLVLHGAISGDAGPLRRWAASLPVPAAEPEHNWYFLNFLASHDGVGLSPAMGLVDPDIFAATLEEAKRRGALISYKSTAQGEIPYELNCSYASVIAPESMGDNVLRARAFLAVHGVLLSLSGLPAVYFHSWIGSENWTEGPELLGYNRAINREKPAISRVQKELDDPDSFRFHVYRLFGELLSFRQEEGAFDPDVPQYVLEPGEGNDSLFIILRGASGTGHWVLCLENLCGGKKLWKKGAGAEKCPRFPPEWEEISLEGWECLWLVFDKNGPVRRISTKAKC
jgi:sucrose phosphorylase